MTPSVASSSNSSQNAIAIHRRKYFFNTLLGQFGKSTVSREYRVFPDTDGDGIVRWSDLELLLEVRELISANTVGENISERSTAR